jgi:hypothetical protein
MPRLALVPEILQQSVPKIVLAPEILHTGFDSWFDPLRRRPLWHVLGRWAGMLLDALPSRSRISRLTLTDPLPTYLRVPGSAINANAGFPASRSTPSSSNSPTV